MALYQLCLKQMIDKLSKLLEKLPKVYQPIIVGGEVVNEGGRKDNGRLDLIKSLVDNDASNILDIGSNSGYFAISLAKAYPNSVVLSVERDKLYVDVQKEWARLEGISNLILVHGELTNEWLDQAHQACVYFDTVLMASVLHHMDDAIGFYEKISKISRNMIMEIPYEHGPGCGKKVIKAQLTDERLKSVTPNIERLEYTYSDKHGKSYLEDDRRWYVVNNEKYSRTTKAPNIDAFYEDSPEFIKMLGDREYTIEYDGEWVITKKCKSSSQKSKTIKAVPGFVLSDILRMEADLVWPPKAACAVEIIKRLDDMQGLRDVGVHNMLIGANGVELIDYESGIKHDRYLDIESIMKRLIA